MEDLYLTISITDDDDLGLRNLFEESIQPTSEETFFNQSIIGRHINVIKDNDVFFRDNSNKISDRLHLEAINPFYSAAHIVNYF